MGAESRRETWVLDLAVVVVGYAAAIVDMPKPYTLRAKSQILNLAVVVVGYAAAIVDMACHISQRVPV